VANIKSFPNNQNEYVGAEYVMRWLHGRTSGVFGADGNAAVAPVLDAMAVTVSDGDGWISNDNADGVVWWIDNEVVTGRKLQLPVDMADAVLPRIDRVIVSWQTTNYVALPEVSILKGVPASAPVAPTLTNNNVLRQISLAAIHIPAGSTAITSVMITDERLNPEVCGIVSDRVTADTSMVNAQYLAAVAELRTAIQQAWNGEIPNGSITQEMLDPNIKLGSNDIYIGTEEPEGDDRPKLWIATDDNREVGTLSMKLLWVNASPSSDFAPQSIALDLAPTDKVLVQFTSWKGFTAGSICSMSEIGRDAYGWFFDNPTATGTFIAWFRAWRATNSGVTFEDGWTKAVNANSSAGAGSGYMIPVKIYRIRGAGEGSTH
jgi:hypothetical protein